ncbi:PLP-dependent aminotransferase family protein [Gemmobacter denitrificans]|uniref:PLP-dependent aminotransferase family protein n=1 Tax=Gemmobacter denitrificans TaxID=3123040 RepID=A0ABU8BYG9_9RHOB
MKKNQTNFSDWPALVPALDRAGPRHRALYAAIRAGILSGALPAGARLPPSRVLAAGLGLSRGAVVTAYDMLVADGFAEARVGSGTHVAGQVPRVAADLPAPPADPAHDPDYGLPGDLGLATVEPRSLQQFRAILHRQMARPPRAQFAYGDARGDAGLRGEIAAWLALSRGVKAHPDQIVLTAGTQGALDLIARAVLRPGMPVWIEDPGYPMARAAFCAQQLVPVPVDGQGLDVAAGIARSPEAAAAYLTPSHQFPTGVVLTMPRRLALLDWAVGAGAWLIEDDYDSEFRHAGQPLAALQGMDGAGRVIYVGTFSKTLMPGLRLGYMILPEPLLAPVLSLRRRADRYPPTLAEAALAEFLRDGHFAAHLRRARRSTLAARDALVAALHAGGLQAVAPDQGLHLVAPLPEGCDDRAMARAARASGFGTRALSPMYLGSCPRPGLVIGFSGHTPDALQSAARRWLTDGGICTISVRSGH